ncbi:MAG: hypothetical protein WBV94_05130 [Blastocatellia bacterium]
MSNDDTRNDDHSEDFETRTKNLLDTIIENQAKFSEDMRATQKAIDGIQQAIVGLIQVARTHDDQIDRNSEQIKELGERVDALIRVVESHVSNHP